MKSHIKALLEMEEAGKNLRFDRSSKGIYVSCSGYNHQDLMDAEEMLLKLGCKYDLKSGVQKFDKLCGRTFTHFFEPVEK